jgi:FkbM family methyltransferase
LALFFSNFIEKGFPVRSPLLAGLKGIEKLFGGSGLGRVKPMRRLYDFVYGFLKPRRVKVQGHLMWLDEKDALELATNEIYEPVETALIKKALLPGDVFIDIGANIGYYTLLAARLVGPHGRVVAFEPDPSNFRLLGKNIFQNGYSNVIPVNLAVSDRSRNAHLFRSRTNPGDHRIYDSGDRRESIPIRTVSLDDYFKKLDKRVHFIKMDIQGAEAKAFQGMKGLVRANRHLGLVAEFCGKNIKNCGSDPKRFLSALKSMGFKVFEISEKDRTVKPATPAYLLSRYNTQSDDYTNLFCVKGR